jgi:hypothetical protein
MKRTDWIAEVYADEKASQFLGAIFRHDAAHYVIRPAKAGGGYAEPTGTIYSASDFVKLPSLRLSSTQIVPRYQLKAA